MSRRSERESDLDRELRSHLEEEETALREGGGATDGARRALGNVSLIKEEVRESWSGTAWANFLQDVRYGARNLWRTPGFTCAAILTLALGIGGNTAVFSVIHTVLLRPLPYRDPARLVRIWETHPIMRNVQASYPDFEDWRRETHAFEDMAAYTFEGWQKFNLVTPKGPEVVLGSMASQNLLPLMGVDAVAGRNFLPDEIQRGRDDVALIGFRFWQRDFGGDREITGRILNINGSPTRVVGVLPDRREFPLSADVILPVSKLGAFDLTNRKHHQVEVIARLKGGVSIEQARTEVDTVTRRLQNAFPATNKSIGSGMAPLAEAVTGDLRKPLLLLMGSVGFVLLIACLNVAHLLLARSAGRAREIAIRVALGAGRRRLFTQLLTESMLLALMGAAAGLLLAAAAVPLIRNYTASRVPRLAELTLDPMVLAFTMGVAIFTGLVFGILPAARASRRDQTESLRGSGAVSSQYRDGMRIRRLLIVTEVALAMIVVTGAGLLVRSFSQLLSVNPGFRTDRVLTMRVPLQGSGYQTYPKVQGFYDRLTTNLRSVPGVKDVSTIDTLPFRPGIATRFAIKGDPAPEAGRFPVAQARTIAPNYPQMMGVTLRAGRQFTEADATATAPPLCQVNEAFVRRFLGGREGVGRGVILGVMDPQQTSFTIVGVLADTRGSDLAIEADPTVYLPGYATQASVLVSTSVDPMSIVPEARRIVAGINRDQPIAEVQTVQQILDESLSRRRLATGLLGLFSVIALVLAATGLYAVVSYSVSQRTQEFGLRMALGASRSALFGLVLRESILMNGLGLVLGLLGSIGASRLLGSMLYNVGPTDPVTLAGTSGLLFVAGMLGALIPSRRAASVDPMLAIRHD
jgi:predicted permease